MLSCIRYKVRNQSDLDFGPLKSFEVKCYGAIGTPMDCFPLLFNGNIGPTWAPLGDIRLQNVSDLVFDISRSLKVKSRDSVLLPTYKFLLVSNSNHTPVSNGVAVIGT